MTTLTASESDSLPVLERLHDRVPPMIHLRAWRIGGVWSANAVIGTGMFTGKGASISDAMRALADKLEQPN